MNGNIESIQNYADFYSKYVDFFFFFQKHFQLIFQVEIKLNKYLFFPFYHFHFQFKAFLFSALILLVRQNNYCL